MPFNNTSLCYVTTSVLLLDLSSINYLLLCDKMLLYKLTELLLLTALVGGVLPQQMHQLHFEHQSH